MANDSRIISRRYNAVTMRQNISSETALGKCRLYRAGYADGVWTYSEGFRMHQQSDVVAISNLTSKYTEAMRSIASV